MSIKCHRGFDGLGVSHVKPLEHILYILGLTQESPFLHLLDLKPKEELQFPIIDISNLLVMILLNSSQNLSLVELKIISST
jgi:hypothetical protein